MGLINGDAQSDTTFGQLLVKLVELAPWGDQALQEEGIEVVHKAYGDQVTPYGPAPSTGVSDPTVQALSDTQIALAKAQAEQATLRAQLAEAEAATLRAQLAAAHAGVPRSVYAPDPAAPADPGNPATTNSEVRAATAATDGTEAVTTPTGAVG